MVASVWGYRGHIRRRGDGRALVKGRLSKARNQRWVVKRTDSWLNRFRGILIRWEKKAENYIAGLHLACAYVTLKLAAVFG